MWLSPTTRLLGVAFFLTQKSSSFEIRRISERIPLDTFARRVKVDGAGDCFVYEGDVEYDYYNGTWSKAFGENIKHIWKTCGVFDDVNGKKHTLLSSLSTFNEEDDSSPAISNDGSKVCYHTQDIALASYSIAVVDTDTMAISYYGNVLTKDYEQRKSTYCDISPDGSVVVFQSSASLVKNVTNALNKYYPYATYDHGASFVLPSGKDIVNEGQISLGTSSYAQLSNKGRFITYLGKVPYEDPSDTPFGIKTSELYLYDSNLDKKERLTNFNKVYCNLTYVYEKMKDHWGADNLLNEGVSSATFTSCNLAATLGWQNGANLLGAGHGPARLSNNGRFIAYTAGFDHANVRGTHEKPQILTADNLFLYDTFLGLIWQITKEGDVGSSDIESRVEAFCCPTASSSKKRGTCSKSNEYKGFCCWQRPCWFPAQWPELSGDGSSIAFFTTLGKFPGDEVNELHTDYEVHHYHIPTSTKTVITNTNDKDLDDTYPSISYSGEVVAFESDYDHTTGESIISNNQVFAAKLSYGCPQYTDALNYIADADVNVKCEWPKPGNLAFSGHGILVQLKLDPQIMLSTIPFKVKQGRLCQYLKQDVISDLAYILKVPDSFLKIQKRRCALKKKNGFFTLKIGFLSSTESVFDKLIGVIGQPEDWFGYISTQFNDIDSDFWKSYLLKTTMKIESLSSLSEGDYKEISQKI